MTVLAKITLAAALLLSIAVPFGAFAAGEKTHSFSHSYFMLV